VLPCWDPRLAYKATTTTFVKLFTFLTYFSSRRGFRLCSTILFRRLSTQGLQANDEGKRSSPCRYTSLLQRESCSDSIALLFTLAQADASVIDRADCYGPSYAVKMEGNGHSTTFKLAKFFLQQTLPGNSMAFTIFYSHMLSLICRKSTIVPSSNFNLFNVLGRQETHQTSTWVPYRSASEAFASRKILWSACTIHRLQCS
jgi:hypothetical protein